MFQHPELLLASYNTNEDSPHDPDGVALIWNMKFKKQTPEYVFHCQVSFQKEYNNERSLCRRSKKIQKLKTTGYCTALKPKSSSKPWLSLPFIQKTNYNQRLFLFQSAIMSSCFAEFHPNLIVGGTYSGQIVLWDNRVNKRTPIQRTPLSAAAHTVSILYLFLANTQLANRLKIIH